MKKIEKYIMGCIKAALSLIITILLIVLYSYSHIYFVKENELLLYFILGLSSLFVGYLFLKK